jgi:hypothetical protein
MAGDRAYLAEIRNLWQQNFVAAILTARLNHERIPPETAAVAQRMNSAFQADRDINSAVESGMASLGVFGGGGGGFGMSSSYDPEEYMFNAAMGMIAAHRGNPPATPGLRAHAARALTGQLDPLSLLEQASPQLAGTGVLRSAVALAGDMAPLLGRMALLMAALAVPEEQIPSLLAGARSQAPAMSGGANYAASAGSYSARAASYSGSRTSTLAIVSAVCGVASWIAFPFIAAIGAIITGHMAKREIRDANGSVEGGGLATLGLVAGYLNVVVSVLALFIILAVIGSM